MKTPDYRSEQVLSLMMGPSALRIAEELCADLDIPENARILDLGCGRGLSTLHLAGRFPGATVFAADLWIEPDENLATFRSAGVDDRVIPLKAEVHELPFAAGYFDAVVSIDSWHYYGFEPGFLETHVAPLLVPGGQLLAAIPGWKAGHDGSIPAELGPWVKEEYHFHTGRWWAELWNLCPLLGDISTRDLDCSADAWDDWLSCDNEHSRGDIPMMEADAGRWIATTAVTARRRS